jgi:hypothetical protein
MVQFNLFIELHSSHLNKHSLYHNFVFSDFSKVRHRGSCDIFHENEAITMWFLNSKQ